MTEWLTSQAPNQKNTAQQDRAIPLRGAGDLLLQVAPDCFQDRHLLSPESQVLGCAVAFYAEDHGGVCP